MWIYSLSTLVVISAVLAISAEHRGSKHVLYFFKPFTVLLIILVALTAQFPVAPCYKYLIVAGLVCSLVGDVCLMLPSDRFIHGLVSFLIAHLFYTVAFLCVGNRSVSAWIGLPFAAYGGLMLWWLWRDLGKLKLPVMVYVLALLLMAWMASSRYVTTKQGGSLLAAVGAILFVVSDSLLAVNRFKTSFRFAQLLILTTYFIAQCLIALST